MSQPTSLAAASRPIALAARTELDPLLAPLVAPLRRASNALLDLRTAARTGTTPGRCIRCYFQLLAAAPASFHPRLTPLRAWLEAHIEAAACDAQGHLLETCPIQHDSDDLESCCHALMREFHESRAYPTSTIELRFRYKSLTHPVAA